MSILTTDSIILYKKQCSGHIFYTTLTKDYGLLKISAFGGARLSKRFNGEIDYFKLLELEIEKKNDFFNLKSYKKTILNFNNIYQDIYKYVLANYIQELCINLLNLDEKNGKTMSYYDLIKSYFKNLNEEKNNDLFNLTYETTLLLYKETGFLGQPIKEKEIKNKLIQMQEYSNNIICKNLKSFEVLKKQLIMTRF
jgi:DNA repair protein RecO